MDGPTEDTVAAPRLPLWPAVLIGLMWAALTPFLVGIVATVVTLTERVAGRGAVNGNGIAAGTIEAFVYLIVAFGVFRMARRIGVPCLFWLAGPGGYVLGAAGYVLLGMAVGGEPGPGAPIAVIAVDTVACALGAYAGTRGAARRADVGPPRVRS